MPKIGDFEVDEEEHKIIIHYDPNSTTLSSTGKNILLASSGYTYIETKDGVIGVSFNIIKKKKK